MVNDAGNEAAAGETLAAIASAGGNAVLSRFDVGDAAQVDAAVKAIVAQRGRIDILVNNAGITRDNLLMRMTEDDFDAVVRTNLKGTFLVDEGRLPADDPAAERADRQHELGGRRDGERGPVGLRRDQGGDPRLHQGDGPGARFPRRSR